MDSTLYPAVLEALANHDFIQEIQIANITQHPKDAYAWQEAGRHALSGYKIKKGDGCTTTASLRGARRCYERAFYEAVQHNSDPEETLINPSWEIYPLKKLSQIAQRTIKWEEKSHVYDTNKQEVKDMGAYKAAEAEKAQAFLDKLKAAGILIDALIEAPSSYYQLIK